jgi:hypothetical protein
MRHARRTFQVPTVPAIHASDAEVADALGRLQVMAAAVDAADR